MARSTRSPHAAPAHDEVRNTPSSQAGGTSAGSRLGSRSGSQAAATGMGDGQPGDSARGRGGEASSQGLTGAQGSGGGADRGMQQAPRQRKPRR